MRWRTSLSGITPLPTGCQALRRATAMLDEYYAARAALEPKPKGVEGC